MMYCMLGWMLYLYLGWMKNMMFESLNKSNQSDKVRLVDPNIVWDELNPRPIRNTRIGARTVVGPRPLPFTPAGPRGRPDPAPGLPRRQRRWRQPWWPAPGQNVTPSSITHQLVSDTSSHEPQHTSQLPLQQPMPPPQCHLPPKQPLTLESPQTVKHALTCQPLPSSHRFETQPKDNRTPAQKRDRGPEFDPSHKRTRVYLPRGTKRPTGAPPLAQQKKFKIEAIYFAQLFSRV